MSARAEASIKEINLKGQGTAVIVGGTKGIGAGIARRFITLGLKRLILVGRDETAAKALINTLDRLDPEQSTEILFVTGDVSHVRGMKAAAEAIARAVGKEGIDYLLMTQNGVPDCNWVENEDGEAQPFAVQAQSRFVLPYLLIESSSLSKGATVLSICNTGQSLDTLEVDDLSLKKIRASRSNLGYFMDQSKRDSTVIDSCVIEFASRYPQYRFCHIHPGLCKTEQFDFSMFPFPLNLAVRIGGWTFASTPDSFAPIPIYLTLNPDKLDTQLFDHQLKPVTAGLWAQNATNRSALWDKLLSMMK